MQFRVMSVVFCILMVLTSCQVRADWPQFRGPNGAGVAKSVSVPAEWNEKQNIAWKVAVPGKGPSSPIVVGNRVIVTASDGVRQDRLIIICVDADRGNVLWRRQFWATGRTMTNPVSSVAAPTPVSDGQSIYAFFSSNDMMALDLDGNLQWHRGITHDYPKAGNDVGMSSSPVVAEGTVVAQVENFGDSFAMGLDAQTGQTRWKVPRAAAHNWSSPAVYRDAQGKQLLLLQSAKVLTAHDPVSGEQVWQYEAGCSIVPSPVAIEGRIYLPASGLTALEPDASAPKLAWTSNRLATANVCPVVDGDRVYVINGAGVLNCGDAKTGDLVWQLRIGGTYWATPVIAGSNMICINQEGKAKVVRLEGDQGEIIGESDFGEGVLGTPAISNDALFVRSQNHLWKIATGASGVPTEVKNLNAK